MPQPTRSGATDPITSGVRIFTCGHSFHATVMPDLVAEMAALADIPGHTIVGVSMLGGSRASQHFELPDAENPAKAGLVQGNIDVLTLSCMERPDDGIDRFALLAAAHNPRVRVTLQELWLPEDHWPFDPADRIFHSPDDFNHSTLDALTTAHAPYFSVMEAYVTAVNARVGQQVLFIVPDAQATLALRAQIIAGAAPGLQRQAELFVDAWGHPASPLRLLSAYCHFAVIYRRSPVGLPIPPSLVEQKIGHALNRLLQELAWTAVISHPLSGVRGA